MRIQLAEMIAWEALAPVAPEIAPDEADLVYDVAWSSLSHPSGVGYKPGAMDAGTISSVLIATALTIADVLKSFSPKLVDATLDLSKDLIKQRLQSRKSASTPDPTPTSADIEVLRRLIVEAGAKHRLAPGKLDLVADSVIAAWIRNR